MIVIVTLNQDAVTVVMEFLDVNRAIIRDRSDQPSTGILSVSASGGKVGLSDGACK